MEYCFSEGCGQQCSSLVSVRGPLADNSHFGTTILGQNLAQSARWADSYFQTGNLYWGDWLLLRTGVKYILTFSFIILFMFTIYVCKSESIYHITEFTLFPFIDKWQQNINRTLTTNMFWCTRYRYIFWASCKFFRRKWRDDTFFTSCKKNHIIKHVVTF